MEYWFWTIVSASIFTWYIVVTVIVTIKGGKDVLKMVRDLEKDKKKTVN